MAIKIDGATFTVQLGLLALVSPHLTSSVRQPRLIIMQRDVNSFPIPPTLRLKLQNAGFAVVADVLELKPSELSKELTISKEEALELVKTLRSGTLPLGDKSKLAPSPTVTSSPSSSSAYVSPTTSGTNGGADDRKSRTSTALEMLREEQSLPPIITFCEELDNMLGGGVPMCKITEICGAPGVGKTQLCIQLCVDTQIPACLGGAEGEAIYIDTEGSFIPQRAFQIAQAATEHCKHMMTADQSAQRTMDEFTAEKVLSGIHYFRCHNHVELLALVNLLPEFLSQHPKVRIIAVDSIAFHFRHDFDDMSLRTRLLNGLAQNLIRIATQHSLAVVLTNQMTTKIGDGVSHLVPALGESWGHACTIRVILYWKQAQRYANLYKSPSRLETTVPYQITSAGVRSAASQEPVESRSDGETASSDNQAPAQDDSLGSSLHRDGNLASNPRKRSRTEPTVT